MISNKYFNLIGENGVVCVVAKFENPKIVYVGKPNEINVEELKFFGFDLDTGIICEKNVPIFNLKYVDKDAIKQLIKSEYEFTIVRREVYEND